MAMLPAVAGTQSAESGRRRRRTIHWATPIALPAIAPAIAAVPTVSIGPSSKKAAPPPIGKPRKAAPQAGQNHLSPRGLTLVLFRIMVMDPPRVLRTRSRVCRWDGLECLIALAACPGKLA